MLHQLPEVSFPVRKAANPLYDNFKNATWVQAAGRSMALTHKRCAIAQQGSEAKRAGVADVVYQAIDSFVAKYEAEAELEKKIIHSDARRRFRCRDLRRSICLMLTSSCQ